MTCRFEPHRLLEHRAADLVTDVGELRRLDDLHVCELTAVFPALRPVRAPVAPSGGAPRRAGSSIGMPPRPRTVGTAGRGGATAWNPGVGGGAG